ncbi:MAG TPA: DUF5694 domain-containing protein [Acidobacteriota bacterium]|jgi:hypothetical protein
MKSFLILVFLTLAAISVGETPSPIQVLVLGMYHMGNPGLDLHNVKADDVTTAQRQKELADVAVQLAKFNPTKIALERVSKNEDFSDDKYVAFKIEDLTTNRDERYQIGYRLAKLLNLSKVYGIDEHSDVIDYFPYGAVEKFAKEHGKEKLLVDMSNETDKKMKTFEESQKTKSVKQLLLSLNDPKEINSDQDWYYNLLQISNHGAQPGAELNAYWYMRNAKIFSKLVQVAKPGDRIVILFGAGHNFWLRHFAQHTPGFVLVEASDYLK